MPNIVRFPTTQTLDPRFAYSRVASMNIAFVKITQIRNSTDRWVRFRVLNGVCPIRDLPPHGTEIVKLYRIRRRNRDLKGHWNIIILIDSDYTGIEISSWHILKCVRIVFRYEEGVFGVEATPENCSDFLLRHGCFGFMRDASWDNRRSFILDLEDSVEATKRKTALRKKNHQKHGLKESYEEGKKGLVTKKKKKGDRPVYSSIVNGNESTIHTSAVWRISADSTYTQSPTTLEKVLNSNMMPKSPELRKIGELNVSSAVSALRTKKYQKHEQKAPYEEGKKNDHPVYISTVTVNESTFHPSASSGISADSTNHKKLDKVPNSDMKAKLPKGELNVSSAVPPEEVNRLDFENQFERNASSPDRGHNCGSSHSLISCKVPEELSLRGSGSPQLPIIRELQSDWDTDRHLPPSPRNSSDFHDTDNHVTLKRLPSSTVMAKSVDQLKKHRELNDSTAVPPEEQRRPSYEVGTINRLNLQSPSSSGISPHHAFNSPENGLFSITCEEEVMERCSVTGSQIPPSTREGQRNLDMDRRSSHPPRFHKDSFVHAILLLLAFTIGLLVRMYI